MQGSPPSTHQPVSVDIKERQGRGCGVLFGLLFFCIGVAVFYFTFVGPMRSMLQAQSWPATPCTIVSSSIETHRGDKTTYSVLLQYSYKIGQGIYSGERYSFSPQSSGSYGAASRLQKRYPASTATTCYVDPANPSNAVLSREFHNEMWLGLLPLLFVLVGGIIMVASWRSGQSATGPRANWKPGSHGPGSAGSFPSSGHYTPGQPPPSGYQPGGQDGPLTLKSRTGTPVGRAIALFFVAVFWNGITFAGVYHTVSTGSINMMSGFIGVFLLPFLLIGAVIIVVFMGQLLAILNARPVLTLAHSGLRPGESLTVSWKFGGGLQPKSVYIYVEGREEATYRRGTDTYTEKGLFFRQDLYGTDEPPPVPPAHVLSGPKAGQFELEIPPGLMHTFEAPNNKIVYAITVRGSIPRWPDITEEFALAVSPGANHGHIEEKQ